MEETLQGRFKRQVLLSNTSMSLFKVDGYLFTAVQPEGRGFDFRWCQWNFSLT